MALSELKSTLYCKTDNGMLFQGNCLELMQKIPDKSIDMILCDLPYGTSACKWDIIIPFEPLWEQYKRVIKDNGAIVLFGAEPFSSMLRISNLPMYKYDWKWEKPSGANFLNFKFQPAKVHEDILIFGKMATSYSKQGNMKYIPQMEVGVPYSQKSGKQKNDYSNSTVRSPIDQVITTNEGTRYPRSIQRVCQDKEKLHPTQKPVALFEYLVKTYTNENDIVLDNTCGSGTTAVACENTNRRWICIEMENKYCEVTKNRLVTAQ